MNALNQIDVLKKKHNYLEKTLVKLETKKLPDEVKIVTIKKQKLHIKDRIAELKR